MYCITERLESKKGMRAKKIDVMKIIYVLLVYLEVATARQKIYPVSYFSKYYIGILICIITFFLYAKKNRNKIPLKEKQLHIAMYLFWPMVAAFIYSMVLNLINPVPYSGYLSRSFGLVMYCLLAIIQAYCVYSLYGKKAINYTFVAIACSYFTSIIVAFSEGGLTQFIKMFTDTSFNGSVLEMHEVAPIAAMFLFYFWYDFRIQNRPKNITIRRILICCIIILLSMKRIVFVSCFFTIILFEIILIFGGKKNKESKKHTKLMKVASIVFIFVMLLFVYLIRSGLLFAALSIFNIDTMARTDLWIGIKNQYTFSFFFLGRGLGFVSKWLDNNWMNLGIIGLVESTGLHSDILKYYIELGFVGFIAFFYYYLVVVTKKISREIGVSASILYYLLIVFQFLIWFTDNVSLYHNYQWIMYLMFFTLLQKDNSALLNGLDRGE